MAQSKKASVKDTKKSDKHHEKIAVNATADELFKLAMFTPPPPKKKKNAA